jgi:acetyl-CoA carboxylase carboxyltransferase component
MKREQRYAIQKSLSQRISREALRTLVEKERSLIDSVIDAQDQAHKSYSADN